MESRIRIGISACLLGQPVRFDGGHKHDRYITDILGSYLEFVPVFPEVEAGFPVPRETFRLVGDPDAPRLVTTRTKADHTERMTAWAEKRVRELEKEDLCGFIFKKDSPNSGLMRVKVYNDKGMAEKKGVGLFAAAFTQHFPVVPVEEVGRLNDAKLREAFIEQIFTLKRWREHLITVVIIMECQTNLLEIIFTTRTTSRFSRLLNGRQQQCDQNRDNGNNNQKFDQRKAALATRLNNT